MSTDYTMLIGGEFVAGDKGTSTIVNPATEEPVGEAPEASVEQSHQAAAAARDAFERWSATPADERARLLDELADRLEAERERLVPLIIDETGATAAVGSQMQVPVAIDRFRYYARAALRSHDIAVAPQQTKTTPLAAGGMLNAVVQRQPVGVVACITPYNFPLVNMAGKIAPALAAGCTVVMKPALQDPLAILRLGTIIHEVGFPAGVVNVVTSSDVAPAAALSESPDVDMVSFTGSTAVGERIYSAGAPTMKRLLLELGGKGAALILDDADVGNAVRALVSVWGFHSGQICTAPTRAIVHRSRYDEVVAALSASAGQLKVGPPTELDTIVGPVISGTQRDSIERYIQSAADEGATVAIDGRRPEHMKQGYYVGPTLLADCESGMTAVREEIFGPVIVVVPYDGDDDEGVTLANDSDFGLYSYVFSGDTGRAYDAARRIRSGVVGINSIQVHHEAPFGGFKKSGIGRDRGDFGLHAYTELSSIVWPS
jgi:phenylacetaldehyde dehydrogenase